MADAKTTKAKTSAQSPTPSDANVTVRTAPSSVTTSSTTPTAPATPTAAASPAKTATSTATPAASTAKAEIKYGPRLNVTLNVATVANAFHNALASRSVRYVQYALHDRGFEPGNDRGKVDYDTRKAYAMFQESIGERRTGIPTDYSLNVLGFDVS